MVSSIAYNHQPIYIRDNLNGRLLGRLLCRKLQFRHNDCVDPMVGYAHVLFGARVFPRMVHGMPIPDILRLVPKRETFRCEDREIERPKREMAQEIEEYVDNEYRIFSRYILL